MNTANPALLVPGCFPPPRKLTKTRLTAGAACLLADWRRMFFLHFTLPPEAMAGVTPFELDTHDGLAFVSLVFFELENMRPAGTGKIGRWLMAPVSDHSFLNVRTYVRHQGVPGIQFLAEWIPNPLSLKLGPAIYGLPYRRGAFVHDISEKNGVEHLHLTGRDEASALKIAFPLHQPETARRCPPGSAAEFLLERYAAYTCRNGIKRRFEVDHQPWLASQPDWVRFDVTLVEKSFPWFRGAKFHSAHQTEGVFQVRMGRPHRVT